MQNDFSRHNCIMHSEGMDAKTFEPLCAKDNKRNDIIVGNKHILVNDTYDWGLMIGW